MTKEEFKKALQKAYENPTSFFEIRKQKNPLTGKKELVCNQEKLNDFFQSFSTHFLDTDVANVTQNFPKVTFSNISNFSKYAIGQHNHKTSQIELNLDMFLKYGSSRTVFSGFLTTLCHEHQHFKQNLYVQLKTEGKLDEAKQIESLFVSKSNHASQLTIDEIEQSIKHPFSRQSVVAHTLFMQEAMPTEYKKIKSPNFLANLITKRIKQSPVEVAGYFHDAHEIDARERSLDVFLQKINEATDSNPNRTITKYTKQMEKWLPKINKFMLNFQPKSVLEQYESLKQNISLEHLIKFANDIDKNNKKHGIDPSTQNDKGEFNFDHNPTLTEAKRQAFVFVLKEKLSTMNLEKATEFLQRLATSNSAYAAHIAQTLEGSTLNKLTESHLAVKPVDPEQIKATRIEMGETQPSATHVHKEEPKKVSEKNLTPEELELLEQQKSLTLSDD